MRLIRLVKLYKQIQAQQAIDADEELAMYQVYPEEEDNLDFEAFRISKPGADEKKRLSSETNEPRDSNKSSNSLVASDSPPTLLTHKPMSKSVP